MRSGPITLLLASSAVSKLSDMSDRQFFLTSIIPAVIYTSTALVIWLVVNRQALRRRRISLV